MNITYTISDPVSGHCEDFKSKRKAISEAKKQSYTPVFIDIYDEDSHDIIGDIRVDIKGATEIDKIEKTEEFSRYPRNNKDPFAPF